VKHMSGTDDVPAVVEARWKVAMARIGDVERAMAFADVQYGMASQAVMRRRQNICGEGRWHKGRMEKVSVEFWRGDRRR
jgi:hypothetical protein